MLSSSYCHLEFIAFLGSYSPLIVRTSGGYLEAFYILNFVFSYWFDHSGVAYIEGPQNDILGTPLGSR